MTNFFWNDNRIDKRIDHLLRISKVNKIPRGTITWSNDRLLWITGVNSLSSWWRHQMETFSALLALCAGNSPVTGEFPTQRPVTRSFDVSLICALNKRLSKHSRGWWFETPSHPLWRHCNGMWNRSIMPWSYDNYDTVLLSSGACFTNMFFSWVSVAWISMITHCFQWDMISHPCPNFHGSLVQLMWKLWHGWLITSHTFL